MRRIKRAHLLLPIVACGGDDDEARAPSPGTDTGANGLTIERGPDPDQRTDELAATSTFGGGASDTLDVVEPGRYAMVCTVGNHRELGMVGTITIR